MPNSMNPSNETPQEHPFDRELAFTEFTDHELASLVLPSLDYEAQLIAISDLLRRNKEADEQSDRQIKKMDTYAKRSAGLLNEERFVTEWSSRVQNSIYQSAAHSMAAVGMLAPLIESLFVHAFQSIRFRYFEPSVVPPGNRRSRAEDPEKFWNCHLQFGKSGDPTIDLVPGIKQLADFTGLTPCLPKDLKRTLSALFEYRNKMFHLGFEWTLDERQKFTQRIASQGWDNWFSINSRDETPWIIYMTDEFVTHCFNLALQLLSAFGAYCRKNILNDRTPLIPIEQAQSPNLTP